jgi:hypothetical protein
LLDNNVGLRSYVTVQGLNSSSQPITWPPLLLAYSEGYNFVGNLQNGAWNMQKFKNDDNLHLSDLQGSGTFFNVADLGLLILHGTYGTSFDSTPGHPVKQMYFPVATGGSAQYLRMSDMSFGGPTPTNGLKWMALMCCYGLFHTDWSSMQSQSVKPYNNNLHLFLSSDTLFTHDPELAGSWAADMLGEGTNAPMNIPDAWYQAGIDNYKRSGGNIGFPNPTVFAVAGDTACFTDFLQTQTNTVLSGSWRYDSKQVYPPAP